MVDKLPKPKKWGALVLFLTVPTLLCCALPILLVSLGMGAVVAALYGEHLPFLQWFGHHELLTFGLTAALLLAAAWALYRPGRSCPADPVLADACRKADRWNRRFYWGAVVLWCVGFTAAFILPYFA